MKKITAILLSIVMLCASLLLVSCGTTPEELVNDSVEKMNSLDSYSAKMTTDIKMTMDAVTISIPVIMDIKVQDLDTEAPKMYVKYDMTIMGEKQEMELYMDGEYVYLYSEGEGYKMSFESLGDEAEQYEFNKDVEDLIQTIPADVLEGVEIVKDEDGNRVVEVSIDSESFEQIYEKTLETLGEEYNEYLGEINVDNGKIKITVNDDKYIEEYVMSFTMDMDIAGQSVTSEVTMTAEYDNPGSAVTVTPMEGYESFQLID